MTKPKRERDNQNPKAARIDVRVTPEHMTALRAAAEHQGVSVAALVRRILLASHPPKM
jgi:predicted HicB family RNase H-like nuclease